MALLLEKAFRHDKGLGGWNGAEETVGAAGVPLDAPGVVTGANAAEVLEQVVTPLGGDRVWERFAPRVRPRPCAGAGRVDSARSGPVFRERERGLGHLWCESDTR